MASSTSLAAARSSSWAPAPAGRVGATSSTDAGGGAACGGGGGSCKIRRICSLFVCTDDVTDLNASCHRRNKLERVSRSTEFFSHELTTTTEKSSLFLSSSELTSSGSLSRESRVSSLMRE